MTMTDERMCKLEAALASARESGGMALAFGDGRWTTVRALMALALAALALAARTAVGGVK